MGPITYPNCLCHTTVLGKIRLKFGEQRPTNKTRGVYHMRHNSINFSTYFNMLSVKINKWNLNGF